MLTTSSHGDPTATANENYVLVRSSLRKGAQTMSRDIDDDSFLFAQFVLEIILSSRVKGDASSPALLARCASALGSRPGAAP